MCRLLQPVNHVCIRQEPFSLLVEIFEEHVFTFPFSVVNDICIVFHFGTEKMIHQITTGGGRGLGRP